MRLNPALESLTPFVYCGTDYTTRLDANESCVPVPKALKEEIAQAITTKLNLNCYPDDCTVALRSAYAKAFSVDAEGVVPGNGSDELINMIVGRLIPPGGVVLGFERDFGSYWSNAAIFGRRSIRLPRLPDMTFTADMLIEGANLHNADLVIFSNPNNPSGAQLLREEVIRLIESVDCLVVVDEAYMDFSDQSVLDLAGKYENLIVLRTLSKAMGAAGIRTGFAISTPKLTYALRSVRDAYNVSSVDQLIATILLEHPEYRQTTLAEIQRLMVVMKNRLNEIAGRAKRKMIVYPSVVNFVLLWLEDAKAVSDVLHEKNISLRQFDDHLIRISVVREDILNRVLDELEDILTK
ncbi:MAG TPA: aminotransferase class I/II-fold pyridoxal phosphate-dependent enzyme [Clostridia bacterium]|nr:aminotransferase class I/II-fold pyridoxal phosphate-dependent enzyme [Clostridia bacterium]